MPSPVLENNSPYERLTGKQPEYESLIAFGCICYVSTSSKHKLKFDPRARACVFLGYPSGYKGYKLLDIETHSVSISRHVLFHEDIFPFVLSSLNDNVKSFFPHASSPAVTGVVFSEPTSSDTHPHIDVSSSKVLLPSRSRPLRKKKQPSNLQDFHCYNLVPSTSSSCSTPYPMANHLSYFTLSQRAYPCFHQFYHQIQRSTKIFRGNTGSVVV